MADWYDLAGSRVKGPSETNVFNYDRLVFRDDERTFTIDLAQLAKSAANLDSLEKPEAWDWYVWLMKYKIVL